MKRPQGIPDPNQPTATPEEIDPIKARAACIAHAREMLKHLIALREYGMVQRIAGHLAEWEIGEQRAANG